MRRKNLFLLVGGRIWEGTKCFCWFGKGEIGSIVQNCYKTKTKKSKKNYKTFNNASNYQKSGKSGNFPTTEDIKGKGKYKMRKGNGKWEIPKTKGKRKYKIQR